MKFVVEVEDFYIEEGELATSLKGEIIHQINQKIQKDIKMQVDAFMDKFIKDIATQQIETRVQVLMEAVIQSGKVKGRYGSDPEMTVDEWIKKTFTDSRANISEVIEKKVKGHVLELQKRYDLLFATQLITKIKDQGFLKDEAVKMLLSETD